MSDFTPPSNPEPGRGDDHDGYPAPHGDWGQSPPPGVPPQPSPWGDSSDPANWADPAQNPPPQHGSVPPQYGSVPPQYGSPPEYGQGGYAYPGSYGVPVYQKSSQAVTALVLSIVGLLCCGPLSVVGMLIGRSEVNSIKRGEVDPSNQGIAQAAFVIGLIATLIWVAFILLYMVGIAASVSGSGTL